MVSQCLRAARYGKYFHTVLANAVTYEYVYCVFGYSFIKSLSSYRSSEYLIPYSRQSVPSSQLQRGCTAMAGTGCLSPLSQCASILQATTVTCLSGRVHCISPGVGKKRDINGLCPSSKQSHTRSNVLLHHNKCVSRLNWCDAAHTDSALVFTV